MGELSSPLEKILGAPLYANHSGPCGSLTLWPRRQSLATPVHVDLLPCDHGGNHRPLRSMWISYPVTTAATTGHSGPCGSLTLWPRRQPPATPVHVDLLPCDHGGNHRPLRSMWISYPVTTAATTGHSGPCGSLTLWPRRQPPATPVHVDLLPCDHGGNHRPLRSMWISYPVTTAATTGHSGPCGSLTLWPRRQPPATPVHVDLLPCDHGGNHRPLRSMWISYPVATAAITGHSGPCGSLTLRPRR